MKQNGCVLSINREPQEIQRDCIRIIKNVHMHRDAYIIIDGDGSNDKKLILVAGDVQENIFNISTPFRPLNKCKPSGDDCSSGDDIEYSVHLGWPMLPEHNWIIAWMVKHELVYVLSHQEVPDDWKTVNVWQELYLCPRITGRWVVGWVQCHQHSPLGSCWEPGPGQ